MDNFKTNFLQEKKIRHRLRKDRTHIHSHLVLKMRIHQPCRGQFEKHQLISETINSFRGAVYCLQTAIFHAQYAKYHQQNFSTITIS